MVLAAGYAARAVAAVRPDELGTPTPCAGWDLRRLLEHLEESVTALREGLVLGRVAAAPGRWGEGTAEGGAGGPTACGTTRRGREPRGPTCEPVTRALVALETLSRAGREHGVRGRGRRDPVLAAGVPLCATLLHRAGAVELVVHGWDVAAAWCRAGGRPPPPPPALAAALLPVLPLVVPPPADRGTLFAAPVAVPEAASAGVRLLAALGRRCRPVGPPFG
ncbi:maleylpyruvate isomerase N-terminal domain-containing protein [Streptomyces durbertensis]|uniref:Maleylpyruvate isomerase N-terminal domain-containing protein n=2 Tax=Streptomyces durbertensis TaxID=2448886 RepID=A0ABR6ED06_9ACTN|nr:maleylpyruvate isomerase N-terminal domain-containing protein [Streptomyces durbertensis]